QQFSVAPHDEPGLNGGTQVQIVKTIGMDTRLKEYHGKMLICEGKNPETGHIVQDRTLLNILYDATELEIHGFQNNQIVKAGDTVSIECLLRGGNPVGKVQWEKARPDTPTNLQVGNVTYNSILLQWQPGFDGGAPQQFQIRYRLQTSDRYHYEDIPPRITAIEVKNLEIGTTYLFSIRANNSFHLSPWTDEFSITTSRDVPQPIYPFVPQTRFSLTVILIVCALGIFLLIFNIILIAIFVKRRRKKSDNDSTTGTNETEANTVEIFQPPPIFTDDNSGYPFNTYQRYDDEDVKRPFVTHTTTLGPKTLRLSPQNQNNGEKRILQSQSPVWKNNDPDEDLSYVDSIRQLQHSIIDDSYAAIKKGRFSPYDNLRINSPHHSSDIITYRSFKENHQNTNNLHHTDYLRG
ncbi:unnamed protein product, partial [Didymodactylos carnosus]